LVGDRVAPVIVSAVVMMHITARTLGRVTTRHGNFGCFARQETLCTDPLDRIASIAAITQLDAVVAIEGTLDIPHPGCAGVLPLSPEVPPQRQRNQHGDSD
jgi:hypothetical protein